MHRFPSRRTITIWHEPARISGKQVSTTANVNPSPFGKLLSLSVDGQVYAQPLYLPSTDIGGRTHDVLFVATEHDSVYAFDADVSPGATPTPLWHVTLLGPGERTAGPADVLNCHASSRRSVSRGRR